MGRKKLYERQEVLDAATNVFWKQGYRATSISDLTEATGINRKSLYAEFGGKEQLFMDVLENYKASRVRDFAMLVAKPLGISNLEAFFEFLAGATAGKGCLFTLTSNEADGVPAEASNFVSRSHHELERLLAANLKAEGLQQDAAAEAAVFLLAVMQGILTLARSDATSKELSAIAQTALQPLRNHKKM